MICRIALLLLLTLGAAGSAFAEDDPRPELERPGVARLIEEIRARSAALDRRERAVAERERSLTELEAEVEALLAELRGVRVLVEERIGAWQEDNGDTLRRLAKIYAAMPPERAARLVEGLDLDLATQVVAKMKHKQSAQVMALLSRERALAMSRHVVHPLRGIPAKASR